ncbi:MAG: response regulator [Alcanivoracaceae bacterium]|nr:response regulator [Alcanivoracaceae bacterium]
MTINALIVDDSRLACKVLSTMLEQVSIKSNAVHSAEDALDFLTHSKPDIIFMDHTMPGMDGLETIKVIKDNPLTATIPVMMYTAKQGEVYVGRARALGAVDVLPKGMEKHRLHNALQKLGLMPSDATNSSSTGEQPTVKPSVAETPATNIPSEQPASTPQTIQWQQLLDQRLQPYFNRLTTHNFETLQQCTRDQTRRLTKEIHQTLEHFEHALVARMEAQENQNLEEEHIPKKQNRQDWKVIACAVLVVQSVIVWQLWQSNDALQEQMAVQKELAQWRAQVSDDLAAVNQQLVQISDVTDAPVEPSPVISLVNRNGDFLADVYQNQWDPDKLYGTTQTGYQFSMNAQGDVGSPLVDRFYQTKNCQGDSFVKSPNAYIYRDSNNEIWYVDKFAEEAIIDVYSRLDSQGECIALTDVKRNLRRLQRNMSLETGIEEPQFMQLVYHQQ